MRIGRALVVVPVAALTGALAIVAVDPGYQVHPLAGLLALVLPAACLGLARRDRFLLALGGAALVVGGALVYARAPAAIDRAAYTRVEQALLAAVPAYPGSTSSAARTEPFSSSDWGISFLNPPETYVTSRTDMLPAHIGPRRAAAFYARALRRRGLRVSEWTMHLPDERMEVNGWRDAGAVEIQIGPSEARLIARCQRSGPLDTTIREPPPCSAPTTRT